MALTLMPALRVAKQARTVSGSHMMTMEAPVTCSTTVQPWILHVPHVSAAKSNVDHSPLKIVDGLCFHFW